MKIDFDGVQAFVLIAELGGFNKAAEQLHITQTALTRRIQKLEAYLGLKLLDRTTRRVDLTAVGKEFLRVRCALVLSRELVHLLVNCCVQEHGQNAGCRAINRH